MPVDGFYEWQKRPDGSKQPHLIGMADEQPFALAGLWDCWQDELLSFTVLTTTPNEMMAEIHNRMPVILDRCDYDKWLDPDTQDPRDVADLLKPYPAELMLARPVSTYVNNAKHDDVKCVE